MIEEELEEMMETFRPLTPEEKARRLQLPLPEVKIRHAPATQLPDEKDQSKPEGNRLPELREKVHQPPKRQDPCLL